MVPDGFYKSRFKLDHWINDEQASHFVLKTARVLHWKVMWDPCYERSRGGVLTKECDQNRAKYGIQ